MGNDLYFTGRVTVDLPVSDLKASQAWYKGVLGCEVVYEAPGYGWCAMSSPVPGMRIGLGEVEQVKAEGGGTPTFNVYDVAAARARMERLGVRFDGPIRDVGGLVKLTTFYDPDGHKWMLAESPEDAQRARQG